METQQPLDKFEPNSIDWHKYNLAKTREKKMFYELLFELCEIIPEPIQTFGRPRIRIRDSVFSLGLKLYSNYSGRKVSSDLIHARGSGFIEQAPHFNTLTDFLKNPATYDLLKKLLTISAIPLKELEDSFSIDSSGFGSYQYERWKRYRFSKDYGRGDRNYLKGHISIGTKTNVIVACEITTGNMSDVRQMPELLETTSNNFNVKEVSADKGYSSIRMFQMIEEMNALPFIPFKNNANPSDESPSIWREMYYMFKNNKDKFDKKYHKRSNVETTFSMVKMRLGEFLKCKNFETQRNELMMKFICHNICCLVQEMFDNNVHIDFKSASEKYVETKRKYDNHGLRIDRDYYEL